MTPTLGIIIALYFVPSLIAALRGHHQTTAIFLLNLLLGWTFIGWVVALIWSATAAPPAPQSVVVIDGKPYAAAPERKKKPTVRREGDHYVIEE
jgi:hypothetical protein